LAGSKRSLRELLQLRANFLQKVRQFFADRHVLEVDTPQLAKSSITDPNIHSISVNYRPHPFSAPEPYYLQTSPEFFMKRLLAKDSGAIFQIARVFRDGELGRKHQPEFLMLEWYRPGFSLADLMTEVDALLQTLLASAPADRMSYQAMFQHYLHICPHTAPITTLVELCNQHEIGFDSKDASRDTLLDVLLSHVIEPKLGQVKPLFIYDYPASQAALAKTIQRDGCLVAERFEVYFRGVELANGFNELNDGKEQRARFEAENNMRAAQGLPLIPIDEEFLDALPDLPVCSGVAVGLERLMMLACNEDSLHAILAFGFI